MTASSFEVESRKAKIGDNQIRQAPTTCCNYREGVTVDGKQFSRKFKHRIICRAQLLLNLVSNHPTNNFLFLVVGFPRSHSK